MLLTDDAGQILNANFSVETDGAYLVLILDSAGGKSSNGPSRNLDYPRTLSSLLTRLQLRDATLHDALVDSDRARRLPEKERRLINEPIRLMDRSDMDALRRELTRRQGTVAQAPGARKAGNTRKRIRLRLEVPGFTLTDADKLMSQLASPVISTETTTEAPGWRLISQHQVAHREGTKDPTKVDLDSSRHPRYVMDARLRRAIEEHAVGRAVEHYERLGYAIEDVGKFRSYDLHAVRGLEVLRIEVKGSTQTAMSVELTINEVNNADGKSTILVVVDQIARVDSATELPELKGGRLRVWECWQPADEDLQPIRFNYRIPGSPTHEN